MGSYADAATTYKGFVNPIVRVLIDGTALADNFVVFETDIENTLVAEHISTATFKVRNANNVGKNLKDFTLLLPFALMKKIEIKLGYGTVSVSVFKGYIFERVLSLEHKQGPELIVTCVDAKALLRLNTECKTHKDIKKLTDYVSAILEKYSLPTDITASDALAKPMTLVQHGQSDFAILCQVAQELGYEFFVLGGSLKFRKPMPDTATLITLNGENVLALSLQSSMSEALGKVCLYGYNADTKDAVSGEASAPTTKVGTGKTSTQWLGSVPAMFATNLHLNNRSSKPLSSTAKLYLQQQSLSLVTLTVTTVGLPDIVPGRMMALADLGDDWNNTYYIQTVRHTQQSNSYTTVMTCVSNTIAR